MTTEVNHEYFMFYVISTPVEARSQKSMQEGLEDKRCKAGVSRSSMVGCGWDLLCYVREWTLITGHRLTSMGDEVQKIEICLN